MGWQMQNNSQRWVRPREEIVRPVLNIPERWRVLCLVPVGHPAETKLPRTRYEASKVHQEHL